MALECQGDRKMNKSHKKTKEREIKSTIKKDQKTFDYKNIEDLKKTAWSNKKVQNNWAALRKRQNKSSKKS